MYVRKAALTGFVFLALAACGGGGSSSPMLPQSADGIASTDAVTIALPSSGGYGGTMTFAATVPVTSISVTSSTTASSTARIKQSGTLSRFFSVTMDPKVTLTLPALPSFNLTFPATYPAAGKQFYYALQVPSPPGVQHQFRTEGPGLVSANHVFFGASLQPYTITAGQKYTFEFYANTTGAAGTNLLYVLNSNSPANDTITAYPVTATGNTPPVRTIVLRNPNFAVSTALAADADGDLVVAINVNDFESTIEMFAEGANGNAIPSRLFSVPGFVSDVAVDPTSANINVAFGNPATGFVVGTYSPSGKLLRTINPSNFTGGNTYQIDGLATDIHEALIIAGYNSQLSGPSACAIDVFAANAGSSTPPAYVISPPNGLGCDSVAYARSVDHIFALSNAKNSVFESTNNASGSVVRRLTSPQFPLLYQLAVDPTGSEIFLLSAANAIIPLTPSGSTFTVSPYLTGPATGLSPRGLVVAPP